MNFLLAFILWFTSLAQGVPFPGSVAPTVAFTPASIAGLSFWGEATCITYSSGCQTPSSGSTVASWYDQSSNANTFVQSGCTTTPTFLTNQINSLPAISFSGAQYQCLYGTTGTAAPVTLFIVGKYNNSQVGTILGNYTSGGPTWKWGSTQIVDSGDVSNLVNGNTSLVNGTWYNANVTITSTGTVALRLDEASDGGATNSISFAQSVQSLGFNATFTEPWPGEMAAVLIYNSVLNSTQIQQVETYLKNKYGV